MLNPVFSIRTQDSDIAERGRLLKGAALLIGLAALIIVGVMAAQGILGMRSLNTVGVAVIAMLVFGLAHTGYVRVGGLLFSAAVIASIVSSELMNGSSSNVNTVVYILPILVAGLVLGANAVALFGGVTLLISAMLHTFHARPWDMSIISNFLLIIIITGLMYLIMRSLERNVQQARHQAAAAVTVQQELAAQQAASQTANTELTAANEQMSSLLDLVRDLETPVIPLQDGVLVLPIVGHIDTRRSSQLTETVLQAVYQQRARIVIIDITGVSVVDTAVAQRIARLTQAVQLLGARVILTGIRAEIAYTMVAQGIDFSGIQTAGRLQDGVATVLNAMNN